MSRALIAAALLASLAAPVLRSATAATPDSAVQITLMSSGADRVTSFVGSPPAGYTGIRFNDARWSAANSTPCADLAWVLPSGVATWEWAASCDVPDNNIVLRRTFAISARAVLTARLWFAAHGGGVAFINGRQVSQSIGDPTLVDVTARLRGDGATNVLAIGAVEGANGGGIAYRLQITISKNAQTAFLRAHPSFRLPAQPPLLPPGAPGLAQVAPSQSASAPQSAPGVCTSNLSSSVFAVYTDQTSRLQPVSTGWIYQSSVAYQPNVQFPYLSTRGLDLTAIGGQADMPSVIIGGQHVPAVAIASDDQTGAQVLVLPAFTASSVKPVPVSLTQAHNQPVGQQAQVTAYSRARGCMVAESPAVVGYQRNAAGTQIAQLDTVLYNDGADGGVAQDQRKVLLGEVAFDPTITNAQGQPVPLIQPITTLQPALDALIAVLARQQQPTSSQHAIIVNADGSLSRLNGSGGAPAPAATTVVTGTVTLGSPTAVATVTVTP